MYPALLRMPTFFRLIAEVPVVVFAVNDMVTRVQLDEVLPVPRIM